MNVNEMSNMRKSVMLANLCGWEQSFSSIGLVWLHNGEFIYNGSREGGAAYEPLDLYNPTNMALAWRVLNWALENLSAPSHFFQLREMVGDMDLFVLPPADAQRAWLDKVLELAIEAGMVKK